MKKIIQDILKMPYYENYSAVSGAVHNIAKHEDAVQDILEKHNLKEIKKSDFIKENKIKNIKKLRNEWLNDGDHSMLKNNTFIGQPCGKNDSPDFIVKTNNKVYFIECKSAKGAEPMYNSGFPKENYIYVFTSKKYNSTIVYLGQDIISNGMRETMNKFLKKIVPQVKDLNNELKNTKDNTAGVSYFLRNMYQHAGGAKYNDYFTHELRDKRIQNVLNFV